MLTLVAVYGGPGIANQSRPLMAINAAWRSNHADPLLPSGSGVFCKRWVDEMIGHHKIIRSYTNALHDIRLWNAFAAKIFVNGGFRCIEIGRQLGNRFTRNPLIFVQLFTHAFICTICTRRIASEMYNMAIIILYSSYKMPLW